MTVHIAYLSLGANVGNPRETIISAIAHISQHLGQVVALSCFYKTQPWGNTQQPWFVNTAIELQTSRNPLELLSALLVIEEELGRVRSTKYGPRTIDIDILFFDDQVISLPRLQIPHPHIAQRRFVLVPLNEIAPSFIHPLLQQPVSTLLLQCTDGTEVVPLL